MTTQKLAANFHFENFVKTIERFVNWIREYIVNVKNRIFGINF